MLFATGGFIFLPTAVVWANPTGEQVVGGAATFDRQGSTLTVNQATDRLAVNWQDFSIAAGETTHFNMPSSASIALNRVLGGNPSQIYGTLSSNGNIILVNNAGVFVGPGGVVNAASFVGSTLDIDPGQFMNAGQGGYHLQGDSYAPIVNQGSITAEKGDVFLIAQKVENRGTISAPNGRAALVGAGRAADRTEVVLHEVGGSGFAVRVAQLDGEAAQGINGSLPDGEELLNEGEIAAAQAELNASGNIYALAIRNSGTIRAKAVVAQADGTVRLDGGLGDVRNTGMLIAKNAGDEATAAGGTIEATGRNVTASPESIITAAGGVQGGDGGKVKIDSRDTTIVQGKVDVAAPSAGAKGGKVELLGEKVGLFDGAKVDASGGAGGGTVLAGGDYLGGQTPKAELKDLAKQEVEPVKNAKATVMASTAEIKADATVNGDGGKIILWSDEYTGFYGELFARGGAEGGNGGFVETSSKNNLQAWGFADAGSAKGASGNWLLDPLNVTIAGATSGGTPADISTGGTFVPNALNATVSAAQISTALGNGLNVTITTAGTAVDVDGNEVNQIGNITVAGLISSTGNGTLTLSADNRVTINSNLNLSNAGTGQGQVVINANGEDIILNATITSDATVRLNASRDIVLNSGINVAASTTATGGVVSLNAGGEIRGTGQVSLPALQNALGAGLTFNAGGNVLINLATGAEAAIGDLGPGISGITTGGAVEIRNFGIALSTLTANGIRATAGIELIGGLGNLILDGQVFDTGGEVILRSGEATAGIIIPNSSTRLFPKVVSPGTITFDGVVTLNAFDAADLEETGLTVISGSGINFYQSINDGSISVGDVPAAAVKTIAPTLNEQLLLLNSGVTSFQPEAFVGSARAITSDQVLIQYLSLGPLLSFRQEGGRVEFQQPATAVEPATPALGNLNRPTLYSIGSITFDSANIRIFENTYITSRADVYFGGGVDANFVDTAGVFNVNTLGEGGQVIFNAAIGGSVPLGGLVVSTTGGDDHQISINAGATTFAGKNPVKTGALGQITLNSSGSIVLSGDINSTGGAGTIGGNISFTTAENADQNIQLQGNLVTRGGTITFNSPLFITSTARIDNTLADRTGTITFGSSSSDPVYLEGDLNLISGGDVRFRGDLNGAGVATITVQNGQDLRLDGDIGNTTPLGGFRVLNGSGDVVLANNIFTAGGPVIFGMRVRLGDGVTIDTTKLNNADGDSVEFLQGAIGIEVTAGSFTTGQSYVITELGNANQFTTVGATLVAVPNLQIGQEYIINTLGTTTASQFVEAGATAVTAGSLVVGNEYIITAVGNSDFTTVGAAANTVGTIFTATGPGSGTGATLQTLFTAYEAGQGTGSALLTYFTATGAGAGSGTAEQLFDLSVNGGTGGLVGLGSSAQAPAYSARLNSLTVLNAGTFAVSSALQSFGANSEGYALEIFPELNAAIPGGVNILQSNGSGGIILRNGINTSFERGEAGDVTLRSFGTGVVSIQGTVVMDGGSNLLGTVGFDGGDLVVDSRASFIMPGSISSVGGAGSFLDGKAGRVLVDTSLGTIADISFSTGTFDVIQDSQYTLRAGRNFYLGVLSSAGDALTGGVVFQLNRAGEGADSTLVSRGSLAIGFGGSSANGYFYAPSGSALLTYGGNVVIDRLSSAAAPAYDPANGNEQLGGVNLIGQIFTTVNGLASGAVKINKTSGVVPGVVSSGGIFTRGGTAAQDTVVGLQGGFVEIEGTRVFIRGRIDARGSDSLDGAATTLGIGGAGGNVDLEATSVLLARDIVTSGGRGISTLSGIGGGGGGITIRSNVVLDSETSGIPTILFNTQGGLGLAVGDEGPGGAINLLGTVSGTPSTSNSLDLRYGSGTVTMGDSVLDVITLGTLITAADDARSTGRLTINGELEVATLTTYGRGYSIEILGNGSNITGAVTFLNTGYVRIGDVGDTVTFAGGFDALTGGGVVPLTAPSQVRLAGTIVSGSSLTPASGASMLMGPVQLVGNTFLNSNVNEIRMGNVTGDFDLDLLAGIGAAQVTFDGNVGTLAADGSRTAEIHNLFIRSGVTGNVEFGGVLVANSITAEDGTSVTLTGNMDLNLGGDFGAGSQLELSNVEFADFGTNLQIVNRGGTLVYNGAVTMVGGPIELTGAGDFELGVLGTMDGDVATSIGQNLILSGLGSKDFSLGTMGQSQAIGSGLGAAITMSGGDVAFGALTTASGLDSSTANVTFNGAVALGDGDTDTTLDANVTFNNATFTSTDAVFFGDNAAVDAITLLGNLEVGGAAAYTFSGAVNGGSRITMDGGGTKTFEGVVGTVVNVTGLTQAAGSGLVVFEDDVETSAGNEFNGSVTLSGISFTAGAATNLGDSSANTITLNTGGVTLRGAGNYRVNGVMTGAQTLTLNDGGTKTFAAAVDIVGFTQVNGTGLVTFQGNVITSGASTFNSLVTLSGMTFSAGGATVLGDAAGDTISLNTGTVTLGGDGAYTLHGAVAGAQALTLAGSNTKTFNSTVTVGNGTTAMSQADTAGNNAFFAEDLTLNGSSNFARQVTLDGMTVTASGATSLNTVVLSGGAVTLQGAGAYTTRGAVTGGQDLTLSGNGTKTFASTITSGNLTQTGGQVRLGGNVTSGVVDLENVATTASLTVDSSGAAQTYDALTLGGNLVTQSGAGLATFGAVGGTGNLSLFSDAVDLSAEIRNQGSFSAQTAAAITLGGAYLSAVETARIYSTAGASFVSTGSTVTASGVTANTSLTLDGSTGATVNGTTVNGGLRLVTGGVATFTGATSTARSLGITAGSIESGGFANLLDLISVPSLGNITLTDPGASLAYLPDGDVNLAGRIDLNNGDVVLAPISGNFVNSFAGNPFLGTASIRILTQDFFSYPGSAAVPGLTTAFGVASIFDVDANQIGVIKPLLAGSAAPYITEFTTGTGQPYILATQNNAVPAVMMPMPIVTGGAFGTRVSYSQEEVEMMTPAERSALEASQRRQSARVILQREGGETQEIGVPTEGEIPQAKAQEKGEPAPTAQVILGGKPLAGKSDKEKKDSTQLLRLRPAKAVVLRPELDIQGLMAGERMAAEVSVGSAPVAASRR